MDPVVALPTGRLRGSLEGGVAVFRGVPFARPPVGPDRFGAPRAVPAWEGVRDATTAGPTAPQPGRQITIIPEPVVEGEDYLNLNVFTPDPSGAGLPVLVWFHGGGFTAGGNASPWYGGHAFARDGVVVVAPNYRLGAEGFLVMEDAPPNRAVLDWLAALDWVQEHVASFGGDPSRVTIAGQSAGGMACATLLASPRARDRFRAAVCMSGASLPLWDLEGAHEIARITARLAGVEPTRAGFSTVEPDRLVAIQERVDSVLSRTRPGARLPFSPVVDGEVVAGGEGLAAPGRDRPVLLGATAEEFNVVGLAELGLDETRLGRRLSRLGLGEEGVTAYRDAFAGVPPPWVLGQAMTDGWFRAPALLLADDLASRGRQAWLYSFEWRPRGGAEGLGVVHCLDVPFAFDCLGAPGVTDVTGPAPPQSLADAVHGALVRFTIGGDPGWPSWEAGSGPAMVFDDPPRLDERPWPLVRRTWLG